MTRRTKYWASVVIFGAIALLFVCGRDASSETSTPRPRFERLYQQQLPRDEITLYVYHDLETGEEIVCVRNDYHYDRSCWLTGRSWGGSS